MWPLMEPRWLYEMAHRMTEMSPLRAAHHAPATQVAVGGSHLDNASSKAISSSAESAHQST